LAVQQLTSPVKIIESKSATTLTTDDDFFEKLAYESNISIDHLKSVYKPDKNGVLKLWLLLMEKRLKSKES